MAIIQPKKKREKTQLRVNIDSIIAEEVGQYCTYAGFQKVDDFFEEAVFHILTKDKAFKEWKESVKINIEEA